MNETLWDIPVPATGLVRGPHFKQLPKRQCEISLSIEADDGSEKWLSLLFGGVEVYKCTYLSSLTADMIEAAYGKLVSIKNSALLAEVNSRYREYCGTRARQPENLRHLMICFDDGPCYEFICCGFTPPTT